MCECVYLSSRLLPGESPIRVWQGKSFGRVRQYYKNGNQIAGSFSLDKHRFLRRLTYVQTRNNQGATNSAYLRPMSFPEANSASGSSNFDVLQLKRELEKEELAEEFTEKAAEEKNLVSPGNPESMGFEAGLENRRDSIQRLQRKRQMLRRSGLLAKQVISISSARSLGFISQIWVDTVSWTVLVVEVRPHLLSGEIDRLFLEDLYQVGDVVLVQDESVTENELKMNGLDTLVGYNVMTSARRKIGKVRGYNFNINSGVVESLELDSMGMSLIPASLVSTYLLMVEDVIQVAADTVVVHQDAESRMQRLTKGLLDNRATEALGSLEDDDEFFEPENRADRSTRRRRAPSRDRTEEYWDIPMDF